MNARFSKLIGAVLLAVFTAQPAAHACATCYGASDSPLAQGMNMGIITLLGFIGAMLFGIAAFFVYIGVRSARLNQAAESRTQQSPS